jgi:hypothetical protein
VGFELPVKNAGVGPNAPKINFEPVLEIAASDLLKRNKMVGANGFEQLTALPRTRCSSDFRVL